MYPALLPLPPLPSASAWREERWEFRLLRNPSKCQAAQLVHVLATQAEDEQRDEATG